MRTFERRSQQQVRRWLWMTVPVAVIVGPIAVAWAQAALKSWAPGETLTAEDLNANFAALRAPSTVTPLSATFDTPAVGSGEFPTATPSLACPPNTVLVGGGCAVGSAEWLLYASEPAEFLPQTWICRFKAVGTLLDADPAGGAGTAPAVGRISAFCLGPPP